MHTTVTANILIGELKLEFVHNIDINSTFKQQTDTCELMFAKKITVVDGGIEKRLQDVIKPADKVIVKIGYDNELRTEFVGYVAKSVKPGPPVYVYCEDEMYILKRKQIPLKTFKAATLLQVLKYIAPSYTIDCFDMQMGRVFKTEQTAAKTLKKIEDMYGIKSFFRLVDDKPVLISGKIYSSKDLLDLKRVKYSIGKNTISDTLEYTSKEDKRIKLKAISKRENGKDVSVEVGDDDGDVRTLHLDLDLNESELKRRATLELEKFKYDGYTGSVTGFGIPYVRHGQTATIIDDDYDVRKDTDGSYFVEGTNVSFGIRGFRRTATIGRVVTEEQLRREAI